MNEGTILSIGTTTAYFILNLLDPGRCELNDYHYTEKTNTCVITIILQEGYEVDAESFKELVLSKSDDVIEDALVSMKGSQLRVTVNNCREFFASTNQIVLEHKKRSLVFAIVFIFAVILAQWMYQRLSP